MKQGGAERNLAWLANQLVEEGHTVYIILFIRQIDFELHPDVQIIDLNINRYRNRVVKLMAMFFGIAWNTWRLRPSRAISLSRLSGQFFALSLYPYVSVRYDSYPYFMLKRRLITSIVLFNLPNVRSVVCQTTELKQKIQSNFLRKKKLQVVHNPIGVRREELQIESAAERPYFVMVGRLSWLKRIEDAIEAFVHSEVYATHDLRVIGDGPEMEKLKALAEKLDTKEHVIFQGFIKKPYNWIAGARALILCSKFEGFPNVLVESLTFGNPVISTDCSTGPKEIVKPGHNGYLYAIGDIDALRAYINLFGRDSEEYLTCKSNARESIEKFDDTVILKRWKEVLRIGN